jgi:hypothetical protein
VAADTLGAAAGALLALVVRFPSRAWQGHTRPSA